MNEERHNGPSIAVGRLPLRIVLLGKADEGRPALRDALSGAADGAVLFAEMGMPALDAEAQLPNELANAESLVLVSAISRWANPALLDAEAAELERLLAWIEARRGSMASVSGLPVFLALTQSETLAKADDALADWIDRVQHYVQAVEQRLQSARQQRIKPPAPFGQVELQVTRATAIQRPPTTVPGMAAFGVTELLRQCVELGQAYRQRRRQGTRRLLLASVVALVVLSVVILAGVAQRWRE